MSLWRSLRHTAEPPKASPVGSYAIRVVSLPEELDWDAYLPMELRYLFARHPGVKDRVRTLLANGKAIGVRTIEHSPEDLLVAVRNVSIFSQYNCVLTWLPELLRNKHLPTITAADRARAAVHGANLDDDVATILSYRLKFTRLVLVDEDNIGIGSEEQRFMIELSELLYPLSIDHIVHRVVIDNANERTKIAQNIIKAMLVIGPIAHVLEKWMSGIGKVFAASTDDLLGEAAELMALRGSGFTWRELAKRFRLLVPVFALATYGVFQVEPLLEHGRTLLAGAVFGFSAVALSLTTAIQSIGMYRASVRSLRVEHKLHEHARVRSAWWLAIIQDFTNPARLGLLLGSALAPCMGMLAALAGLLHNGWVLAAVGSTESIVAGITVLSSNRVTRWRFRRKLRRMIRA